MLFPARTQYLGKSPFVLGLHVETLLAVQRFLEPYLLYVQADVVEAASNALLGVAAVGLDPSLGPSISPR